MTDYAASNLERQPCWGDNGPEANRDILLPVLRLFECPNCGDLNNSLQRENVTKIDPNIPMEPLGLDTLRENLALVMYQIGDTPK